MFLTRLKIVLFAALMALNMVGVAARAEQPPLIAAASSLRFALEELAGNFKVETGHSVMLVFGSSGNFSRQIRQGAPFQMFLSADERYVLDLASAGLTRDEGVLYALGRLVIVVPDGSKLLADAALDDLQDALQDGRLKRFAIANPDHAPYGARAREVLQHLGIWQAIQPKLVRGENVGQAAQFAISGNTEGGLVAYSLVLSPGLNKRITYALIPDDWHARMGQRMVLLNNAGPVAETFYAYLQTPGAVATLTRYGFSLPDAGQ